jgi:site-specific recombinase XerD
MLKKLREFGGMEKFKDLTPANVIKWDRFLHDGTRTDNTIFGIHKKIHEYTKRLKDSEMIEKDPYAYVNFPKGRCKERKPLNEDELLKIRQLVLSPKLDRVRDLFVFSAYTGLSFIDVMDFNFDKDTIYQNGMYYIEGNRIKTGSCFYTPILNPAMEVLKKYDNKLPHISNQKANDYLHLIEEKAELKKPLTFHVARHSFATLALSHDVPIEDVAKMLGHHDIKTTQIYAKILHTSIERHSVELGHQII